MSETTVADIMTTPVLTVDPETPVREIAEAMLAEGIKSIAVAGEDCLPRGILTSTDFIEIVAGNRTVGDVTVEQYMTTDVVTVAPDLSVSGAAAALYGNDVSHMPVVDGDDIVGIVTATDITEYVATRDVTL